MAETDATQPAKRVMDQFLEFMADIMEVQEKLTDGEYKTITESATELYRRCVDENKIVAEMTSVMADKVVEQSICVIVRDEPWSTLTAPKICELLRQIPSMHIPNTLDVKAVKKIMDREIRFLKASGRSDPAGESHKRRKLT